MRYARMTVEDDHATTLPFEEQDCIDELRNTVVVQIDRRTVKNNNMGQSVECSCESYTLLFTGGEKTRTVTDIRLVSVRELLDHGVGTHQSRGPHHLIWIGNVPAGYDLGKGASSELSSFGKKSDLVPQAHLLEVFDIRAVETDGSGCWFQSSDKKASKRRFAGAFRANNGEHASCGHSKAAGCDYRMTAFRHSERQILYTQDPT